jgi:uncharacterized protein YifN (PemK superfamily)
MKIRYIEQGSDVVLGIVSKFDIKETLIPKLSDNHSVFISQHFTSRQDQIIWEVRDLKYEYAETSIDITVKAELSQPLSFGSYAKSQQKKRGGAFISQYSIADVDYGHHSLVSDFGIKHIQNYKFTSALLPSELHKKRPCIILNVDNKRDLVQVLPLTTDKGSASDERCLPISELSFQHLKSTGNDNPSHAMLDMIQSVSSYRVYPRKLLDGNIRYGDTSKIQISDRKAIEQGLSGRFSKSISIEKGNLEKRLDQKGREIKTLLRRNQALISQMDEVEILLRKLGSSLFDSEEENFNELLAHIKLSAEDL